MRSTLLAALFAFFATACASDRPASAPDAARPATVDELASKTVALVQRDGDDEAQAYCTGVWVGETTIMTAAHCVADEEGPRVTFLSRGDMREGVEPPMLAREASIAAVDSFHDVALLRALASGPHGVARVSADPVRAGDHVRAVGHSLGLWWSYSSGEVSSVRILDVGEGIRWWVQSTAPISPGNSGGGLFDDAGDLVGICSGTFPRGQNLNLYVHPMYLTHLLEKAGS